ncbi:reverse transcriptase domain-containing protein [Tanacetum coccineum]
MLYVYLATSRDAVRGFLVADQKGEQTSIRYVSQTLHEAERNYATLKKLALCLLHLSRRLCRPLPEGPDKLKFIIVAFDYFTKWMEAKPLAKNTGKEVQKFMWENIVCRFGLPRVIMTDNGTQLANGLVERANKSLMHGLKARLGRERVGWVDELPNILWAHWTMLKTSNGETPFSLTYGSEAVIPAEIGMLIYQTIQFNEAQNDEEMRLNLDLI